MGIFDGDVYAELREKRVAAIVSHFGEKWFAGKSILEVGCGHADMGYEFVKLGGKVLSTDSRREHIEVVKVKYPSIQTMVFDLNSSEWPFDDRYDLILNMGTLYHLKNFEEHLRNCLTHCNELFLETIVSDSDDPNFVRYAKEAGEDQSSTGTGCRPSWKNIERIFLDENFSFKMCMKGLDSKQNLFSWRAVNSEECFKYKNDEFHWLRRAWFASRNYSK